MAATAEEDAAVATELPLPADFCAAIVRTIGKAESDRAGRESVSSS